MLKKIISASCINLSDAIRLLASDSVVGLKIMISYYADILIMGFTRMATEWKFGLLVFGKLSFAFTITNFVLSFVAQIAMVFFPVLKRLKFESRALSYAQLRSILHLVLPLAYLAYIPLAIVLRIWVPEYSDSIVYLSFLMPLCVCSCKSNLLFNTFYKIERMEGHLCFINFVTMLLNALFAGLSIGVFNSVELAAFGVSLTVLIRDGIFEKTLSVKYGISFARPFVLEVVAALSFVFSFWALGVSGLLLVLLILAGYYLCSKPDFAAMRNSRDLFRKGA